MLVIIIIIVAVIFIFLSCAHLVEFVDLLIFHFSFNLLAGHLATENIKSALMKMQIKVAAYCECTLAHPETIANVFVEVERVLARVAANTKAAPRGQNFVRVCEQVLAFPYRNPTTGKMESRV